MVQALLSTNFQGYREAGGLVWPRKAGRRREHTRRRFHQPLQSPASCLHRVTSLTPLNSSQQAYVQVQLTHKALLSLMWPLSPLQLRLESRLLVGKRISENRFRSLSLSIAISTWELYTFLTWGFPGR